MRDFDIREYNAEDIPALSRLWEKTFEDSPALIADFFRLLPDMGTGLAAVQNGEIVGAAYVIMGMELLCGEAKPVPGGYIYAVAVEERCRGLGIGSALTLAARDEGLRRASGRGERAGSQHIQSGLRGAGAGNAAQRHGIYALAGEYSAGTDSSASVLPGSCVSVPTLQGLRRRLFRRGQRHLRRLSGRGDRPDPGASADG